MSLRARLEAKRRVETFYDLAVEDPTAAEEELAAARADLRLLEARADDMPDVAGADAADGLEPARARLTAAEQKLQDCYERIRFAALAPPDFEALIAAHPAGDDAHRWNASHPSSSRSPCARRSAPATPPSQKDQAGQGPSRRARLLRPARHPAQHLPVLAR